MSDLCRRNAWLVGAVGAVVLAFHAAAFWPFVIDDAYISLRYADRFLAGQGLTWTAGEAVEGYSNLLWTLGLAALRALGLAPEVALRVLGGIGGASCVAAVVLWCRRSPGVGLLGTGVGVLVVATSGAVALWTVAGLEASLFAGLVGMAAASCRSALEDDALLSGRLFGGLGVLLVGLTWLRPEGIGVALLLLLVMLDQHPRRRRALRPIAALGGLALAAFAGQLAFRWLYYGDWVPNPARAKVAFRLQASVGAWATIEEMATYTFPVLLLAGLGLVLERRRGGTFAAGLIVGWLGYIAAFGVTMSSERHLVVLYPLLAMLAAEATAHLGRRWGARVAAAVASVVLIAFAFLQRAQPDFSWLRKSYPQHLTQRGLAIGEAIHQAFGERDPLLAVDAAGAIPYAARTRALDMLGLTDRWLAHHPPEELGLGVFGHELGNGDYLLRRAPDIIVAGMAGSDALGYRTGADLRDDARFSRRYVRVNLRTGPPSQRSFAAFLRVEGALGIRGGWVPAALLARDLRATLRGGSYVLPLPAGRTTLPLPPGHPVGAVTTRGVAAEVEPRAVGADTEEIELVLAQEGELAGLSIGP